MLAIFLLDIMTLTPYCANRIAIDLPIPVDEAVMIATFPFIFIVDKIYLYELSIQSILEGF